MRIEYREGSVEVEPWNADNGTLQHAREAFEIADLCGMRSNVQRLTGTLFATRENNVIKVWHKVERSVNA